MKRHAIVVVASSAVVLTIGITASGGAQGQGNDRTITVYEKGSAESFKIVDAKPFSRTKHGFPVKQSPGDTSYIRGPLYSDAARTAKVGNLVTRCASTNASRRFERLVFICDGAITLSDGAIDFHGVTKLAAKTIRFAVIGGTGAYEGARGQMTVVNDRGNSTDTIHLLGR